MAATDINYTFNDDTEPTSHRAEIFKAGEECQLSFRSITTADNNDHRVITRIPVLFVQPKLANSRPIITLDDVRDDYEQFRVWSQNLGVFASGHSSLDFRLRDAEDLRDGFVSLLGSLSNELNNCLRLLQADRTDVCEDDQGASSGSSSESDDSVDSGSLSSAATKKTAYELQIRFRHVSDIIDKLIRLAEVIRASGSTNRAKKATAFVHVQDGVNLTEQFETKYLPLVLKHRFNLAEPLLGRFVKAISLRRRYFMYQAKHQKRLAYGGKLMEEVAPTIPRPSVHRTASGAPLAQNQFAINPDYFPVQSLISTPTKATTFQHIPTKARAPSRLVSGSTQVSIITADIPAPPSIVERATHFECPYCCILTPRQKLSPKHWRHHIIADLQPYICLEPDCPTPSLVFDTQDDWIEHQKWEHAMEWWCDDDSTGHATLKFCTPAEYIVHLNNVHTLSSSQSIRKHIATAGRPSLTPFTRCPLCAYLPQDFVSNPDACNEDPVSSVVRSQKDLQKHILNELLTIFLIALPDRNDTMDSGTDTDTVSNKRGTIRALSDTSLNFSHIDRASEELQADDAARHSAGQGAMTTQVVPICDATVCEANWRMVWASPALQGSVREAYEGVEHDEILKTFILDKSIVSGQHKYPWQLAFEGINDRFEQVSSPHSTTCQWFLNSSTVNQWLSYSRGSTDPKRLLVVHGDVGTGKSTLMKYAVEHAASRMPSITIIHFFFSAHGNKLQSSLCGLYRSLIIQLMQKFPELQTISDMSALIAGVSGVPDMELKVLEIMFNSIIAHLTARPIACFVDALDEQWDELYKRTPAALKSLLNHSFITAALSGRNEYRLCISSRHPSFLEEDRSLLVNLDEQFNINQDITTYLEDRLLAAGGHKARDIRKEILRKSRRVFLWVVAVVVLLNYQYELHGLEIVGRMVCQIPDTLELLSEWCLETGDVMSPAQTEVIKMLFQHSCVGFGARDSKGRTLLYKAVVTRNIEMVEFLLTYLGIDINIIDYEGGYTPLHKAIAMRDKEVVRLLLGHPQIDVNSTNFAGQTPLILAVQRGTRALVELLLAHPDLDVNLTDVNGTTALLLAAEDGQTEVVRLLIARNDIILVRLDHRRRSAFELALMPGCFTGEISELVRECYRQQMFDHQKVMQWLVFDELDATSI